MKTQGDASEGHIRSKMGLELFVRDVMTTNVIAISKYETIMCVANVLTDKNLSRLLVVNNENKVLGIVNSGGYSFDGGRKQGAHIQRSVEIHAQ